MRKILITAIFPILLAAGVSAQSNFAERCLGTWEGKILIYSNGVIKDSFPIKLIVAKTKTPGDYTWRTDYLSPTRPMTKDYILRVKDAEKGIYITDEGGGVELVNYLHADKLYNVFETAGVMLTASYEIRGKELIFEVTSGKKLEEKQGVINYSVPNLQRAVLKRIRK